MLAGLWGEYHQNGLRLNGRSNGMEAKLALSFQFNNKPLSNLCGRGADTHVVD